MVLGYTRVQEDGVILVTFVDPEGLIDRGENSGF